MGQSLLSQFDEFEFQHKTFSFITTKSDAQLVADEIKHSATTARTEPLVFNKLFDADLQKIISSTNACVISLFSAFIKPLEKSLHAKSTHTMGMPHEEYDDEDYKKHMEVTAAQYLWEVRLEKAEQLLCHTNLPVSEIAYQCGFINQYHFSKKIKVYYGCSPSELRAKEYVHPSYLRESKQSVIY